MNINPINRLKGELKVPGDKSISHRGVMLGSISKGTTVIKNFLMGADCLSTIACFEKMGIPITITGTTVRVNGKGLNGLTQPNKILDVGNSGTTLRLLSGILSGQTFETSITGDSSIVRRPMGRIINPLSQMNAIISSVSGNNLAPLTIKPSKLHGIHYNSPIASAQVKSSIMLAGLYADGNTSIEEPYISRNHTELMLSHFGGKVEALGNKVTVSPVSELFSQEIIVPSDISSAAFYIVAALLSKNSEVILNDVGINPTRDGIIKVLKQMNADIELDNQRTINGELIADIIVRSSKLIGTEISGSIIPTLIDEIPIIAVAAAFAEGKTTIKDAQELKVKESNRIDTMANELAKMGVNIIGTEDGLIINGGNPLDGAILESHHDHRVAMSLTIAALNAKGPSKLLNSNCINISYPGFFQDLKKLF